MKIGTRFLLAALVAPLTLAACFGSDIVEGDPGLTIITQTSGPDLDADGYIAVVVSQTDSADYAMAINDTVYLPDVVGAHGVTLTGVATNCSVSGENPRQLTIATNGWGRILFTVLCQALPADG